MQQVRDRGARAAVACCGLVAVVVATSVAESEPALDVHLTPADFSAGCAAGGMDTLSCDELNVEGSSSGLQFAFVALSGVDSVAALEFGVAYDESVSVLSWQNCNNGIAIADSSWPASESGLAVAWGGLGAPADSGVVILVGYFLVDVGSAGTIAVIGHPRSNEVQYVDEHDATRSIEQGRLGVADVNGDGCGFSGCSAEGTEQASAEYASPSGGSTCELRFLFFESDAVVRGRVSRVDRVQVEVPPDAERERVLPLSVPLVPLPGGAVHDVYYAVELDVESALSEAQPEGVVHLYLGTEFADGSKLLGSAREVVPPRVGVEVLAFARWMELPSRSLLVAPHPWWIVPFGPDDRTAAWGADSLWSATVGFAASRDEILRDFETSMVKAEVLGTRSALSPAGDRRVARLRLALLGPGRGGLPSEIEVSVTGHPREPANPSVPCEVAMPPELDEGDVVWLRLCGTPATGLAVCDGGWGILIVDGNVVRHGFKEEVVP